MAIHGDLEGIEVTICIDGQPVTEYETDNDEIEHSQPLVKLHQANVTVTNYIEAITNKEFSIKVEIRPPYKFDCPTLTFQIMIDGNHIYTNSIRSSQLETTGAYAGAAQGLFSGTPGETGLLNKFKFSKIVTSKC